MMYYVQFVTHYTYLYQPIFARDGILGTANTLLLPDAIGRFGHRTHGWKPQFAPALGEGFGEPLGHGD